MNTFTDTYRDQSLYTRDAERLYLNAAELKRFLVAANSAPLEIRRFALVLAYTGVRISEGCSLTYGSLQLEARLLAVKSLKQRGKLKVREIPIPRTLIAAFDAHGQPNDAFIWSKNGRPLSRITAYRWIKDLMHKAEIRGPQACPKGLRHCYGARAVLAKVPLHMVQRWMGHASMQTTAIYATLLGPEQLEIAEQMWTH